LKQQKRILIIDDDESIRVTIGNILRLEGYRVDTAENGKEGVEKSNLNHYNLALIDFRLPDMEGTGLLTELRSSTPEMVKIMMTGYPSPGNRTEAFDKYADGYIIKPVKIDDLLKIVKERLTEQDEYLEEVSQKALRQRDGGLTVVAIGASAGGPTALERVFSRLPSQLPAAIVISQHMPNGFAKAFAERLAAVSGLRVSEAQDGDVLRAGNAFVTPSGHNMKVTKDGRIHLLKSERTPSPSIDAMMKSVADAYGLRSVGVLLTGMLADGVLGMKAIKDHGGVTIAQDESSSVVFGMNKAAIDSGAVDIVAHISVMASRIVNAIIKSSAARKTGGLNPITRVTGEGLNRHRN
jgi:two-component system chemotaxis response regulator CheB